RARGILKGVRRTVVVNGSGVDLAHYQPVPLPIDPPLFLMISRLIAKKGVREFVAAAAQVKRRHPRARFVLLGREDVRRDAIDAREIAAWRAARAVEFEPSVEDVRPVIARAS